MGLAYNRMLYVIECKWKGKPVRWERMGGEEIHGARPLAVTRVLELRRTKPMYGGLPVEYQVGIYSRTGAVNDHKPEKRN